MGPSSSRLFSLQVPVPPKLFLSLVYKLEGPSNVRVALELTTGDTDSCHVGGILALHGEGPGWPLSVLTGLSPFSGHLREPGKVHRVCGELVSCHPAPAVMVPLGVQLGTGGSPLI